MLGGTISPSTSGSPEEQDIGEGSLGLFAYAPLTRVQISGRRWLDGWMDLKMQFKGFYSSDNEFYVAYPYASLSEGSLGHPAVSRV